jgi:signal transduction histidine kinase
VSADGATASALSRGLRTGLEPDDARNARLILLGIAGVTVCALTFVLALTGTSPEEQRPFAALGLMLTVAIPIAVGLYALYRQPQRRFGVLLLAAGFGWSLTSLAEADSSFLYSIGRVSLWLVEPMVLYLILAFPAGRLAARVDRALVASALAVVAVFFLPTAFLADSYSQFGPLSGCEGSCPANFFMLLDSTPAFVEPMRVVGEVLITLVFVAVAARLFERINHATRLMRRTLSPVLGAAIIRMGAYIALFVALRAAPDSVLVDVFGWILLLTLPGIALGFLIGLLRWRLHVATAMEHLARSAISRPNRPNLRDALAETLEDPTLELAVWREGDRGGWVDQKGMPVDVEQPRPERSVTRIGDNGHPGVALVHDQALREHLEFVGAAGSVALFALENERLTGSLRSSLRELEGSRTRIVAAADRERRRIERDLHDGAQQRLVALRIKLKLADELVDAEPAHAHELMREAESEIEEALEEVRSLARGIYPSLLAGQGLAEALRSAALRVPLSTTVECDGLVRYPPEVESAVYFCCLEALQNAVKHARGARSIGVSIKTNGELRFEVRDDGEGFDTKSSSAGQGLMNIRDRLAAVGGRLVVHSVPGEGTVVRGTVPVESFVAAPAAGPSSRLG